MANTFNARTSESKNKKKRNTLKIIFNERSIIFRLTRREINKSVNVSVNLRPIEYAYTLAINLLLLFVSRYLSYWLIDLLLIDGHPRFIARRKKVRGGGTC